MKAFPNNKEERLRQVSDNYQNNRYFCTLNVLPDLIKFFSSTLSSAGSSSSPTSSMISGLPKDSESSKWLRKYLWLRAVA